MLFWRKKHHLPKFPENAKSLFLSLCEPLPVQDLPQLNSALESAYAETVAIAQKNSAVNIKRAQEIYAVCKDLLEAYPSLPKRHQSLTTGAIRYFASTGDALDDTIFYSGLDDDAKVLNYVLEELGIEGRFIKISGNL